MRDSAMTVTLDQQGTKVVVHFEEESKAIDFAKFWAVLYGYQNVTLEDTKC